ncbi:MAG TPA: HEPN domain-containing protein [Spirochaetota bacterium]|nr:HEPN domain-containing protein [Spirochaetota bacterium]
MTESINWDEVEEYWLEEADNDLKVAANLFEREDYSYSLFFGHLALEKLLKAYYVKQIRQHAPLIHNLERLAVSAGLELSDDQKESLIKISTFNIEARYPDIRKSFRKLCTKEFTTKELDEIKKVYQWVKSKMK